jgi:hypothetical protein
MDDGEKAFSKNKIYEQIECKNKQRGYPLLFIDDQGFPHLMKSKFFIILP